MGLPLEWLGIGSSQWTSLDSPKIPLGCFYQSQNLIWNLSSGLLVGLYLFKFLMFFSILLRASLVISPSNLCWICWYSWGELYSPRLRRKFPVPYITACRSRRGFSVYLEIFLRISLKVQWIRLHVPFACGWYDGVLRCLMSFCSRNLVKLGEQN